MSVIARLYSSDKATSISVCINAVIEKFGLYNTALLQT